MNAVADHGSVPTAVGAAEADQSVLELVTRAIREGDGSAWNTFVAQFSGLLVAHVRRQPSFAAMSEDAHFWVDRAFQRFAMAIGADRLHRFTSPAAVVQYLKLCASSVLLDEIRARRRAHSLSLDLVPETVDPRPQVDEYVVEQLMAEEVWRLIAQELPGESELLVASLSFKYGQKPAEIFARYPDRFPTIGHVYQTKRNVLDRLRRNERLLRLLTADD